MCRQVPHLNIYYSHLGIKDLEPCGDIGEEMGDSAYRVCRGIRGPCLVSTTSYGSKAHSLISDSHRQGPL